VAINSIPQQDVAKGSGHNELARAKPMALSTRVAKNPGPSMPGGGCTIWLFFGALCGFVVMVLVFPFEGIFS
jgi:hypothetical protein